MKPKHVAIIMDGNRRWAKSNNFSLLKHEKGLETLQNTIENCIKLKINYLTVFDFLLKTGLDQKRDFLFDEIVEKFLDKAISEEESNQIDIKFIVI